MRRSTVFAAFLVLLAAPAPAPASPPRIPARAWIVVDARTGERLAGRMTARSLPIASATKLMTAHLALDRLALGRRLAAPAYRPTTPAESRIDLRPGERMAVRDLLYALILASANDAAVTLARGVSGSVVRFVRAMNREARALGMRETRFANPVGLDAPGNRSSARDLATLTLRLRRSPLFRRVADTPRARLRSGARRRIVTRNRLVARVPWVTGVKTGHTLGAGWVLVGSASRGGASLVSVVLGAPSEAVRDAATLKLLRYGFRRQRRLARLRRLHRPAPAAPEPVRFAERAWEGVQSPVTLLTVGAVLMLAGASRARRRRH